MCNIWIVNRFLIFFIPCLWYVNFFIFSPFLQSAMSSGYERYINKVIIIIIICSENRTQFWPRPLKTLEYLKVFCCVPVLWLTGSIVFIAILLSCSFHSSVEWFLSSKLASNFSLFSTFPRIRHSLYLITGYSDGDIKIYLYQYFDSATQRQETKRNGK